MACYASLFGCRAEPTHAQKTSTGGFVRTCEDHRIPGAETEPLPD